MLASLALSTAQRRALEEATADYESQLTPQAEAYLAGRGLLEAARSNRIGQAVEPHPGHEKGLGRLAIPYLTPAGVVAIRFRAIDEETKPKYLSLDGAKPRLYNVNAFHMTSPYIAIVEGEFDALALTHLVGIPAVGVPGATSWLKHYPRCFTDYDKVLVITDNDVRHDGEGKLLDNPGQKLAKMIADTVSSAVVITPEANLDVNDWILRDGPQTVANALGVSGCVPAASDVNLSPTEGEAA